MSGRKREKGTIIIRRNEVVEGGHHGGAWKVAYADFVTAMMAFFLLMWLLNATTQEQKRGLADYFSPTSHLSTAPSGSGAPFGGKTPNSDGTLASDKGAIELTRSQPYPVIDEDDTGDQPAPFEPSKVPGTAERPSAGEGGAQAGKEQAGKQQAGKEQAGKEQAGKEQAGKEQAGKERSGDQQAAARQLADRELRAEAERRERKEFERAASQIREAVASDPALADIAKQLMIDITPEGLRIQLLDAERTPMFSTGSSALNERARAVLAKIAPALLLMKEPIAISGHTDSAPYRGGEKSNWDLSADRANATRRLLVDAGLPETRLRSVTGNADREPLIADDPLAAANRRISIVLLRDHPTARR